MGINGIETFPIYSASKHAIIGFTKSVALEFAKTSPRVILKLKICRYLQSLKKQKFPSSNPSYIEIAQNILHIKTFKKSNF